MKKSKGKENKKKRYILGILILIFLSLIAFLSIRLIQKMHPVYKIKNRVETVKKEKKNREEKVVGWIRVQGTNIDYPIIYNDENLNPSELIYNFVWTNEEEEKLGNRELVIGHNLLNVSKKPLITYPEHQRFEQLMSFIYYDFAKENQYIQYTIGEENYLYKIFAVGFIDSEDVLYNDKNFNKNKLSQYIDQAKNGSFFHYKVDVNSDDDILTLITCTRFYGEEKSVDFRIDARRVRKSENIMHYKVAESSKYDKIKEEMKGDESDEEV